MTVRTCLLNFGYNNLVKPYLFRLGGGNPEAAHEWTINTLARLGKPELTAIRALVGRPDAPVTVAGIKFPGRVGLAAGVDKDGKAARAWAALGFSHAELGTVTALPQPGNPSPRMFRLRESKALLNRMGFNNHGAKQLADRLHSWGVVRGEATLGIPLGISIGKTKITPVERAVQDYLTSLRMLAPYADYIAINVSSPNTPGLRDLQGKAFLTVLTNALVRETQVLAAGCPKGPVPIFVKVAPDLSDEGMDAVLEVCSTQGVRGMIVGNTTLARNGLSPRDQRFADEAGGLSGAPLTQRALELVRSVCQRTTLPVIGVGGIMSVDDGRAMLDAGAKLVQLYSGFVYSGPALVSGLNGLHAPERQPR